MKQRLLILFCTLPGVSLAWQGVPAAPASPKAETPVIMIRCGSTLSDASEPLFAVDGILVEREFFEAIDPDRIETIMIIKGDVATALFGCRARNSGVIVVRLKEPTPEVIPWQEPDWQRAHDVLYYQLDDREVVLKTMVIDQNGEVVHQSIGYDPERGILLEDLPKDEPLVLILKTARDRYSFRLLWTE